MDSTALQMGGPAVPLHSQISLLLLRSANESAAGCAQPERTHKDPATCNFLSESVIMFDLAIFMFNLCV